MTMASYAAKKLLYLIPPILMCKVALLLQHTAQYKVILPRTPPYTVGIWLCWCLLVCFITFPSSTQKLEGCEAASARMPGRCSWHGICHWGLVLQLVIPSNVLIDAIVKIGTSGGCGFCVQDNWGCLHFTLLF